MVAERKMDEYGLGAVEAADALPSPDHVAMCEPNWDYPVSVDG